MSDAYIIEVAGQTAGIAARDTSGQKFRFFAANQFFDALDGNEFPDPCHAERAARRHVVTNFGWREFHRVSTASSGHNLSTRG